MGFLADRKARREAEAAERALAASREVGLAAAVARERHLSPQQRVALPEWKVALEKAGVDLVDGLRTYIDGDGGTIARGYGNDEGRDVEIGIVMVASGNLAFVYAFRTRARIEVETRPFTDLRSIRGSGETHWIALVFDGDDYDTDDRGMTLDRWQLESPPGHEAALAALRPFGFVD